VEVPAAGRRPALVLTRTVAVPVLNRVVVAPATRTVRGIPTEVALDRGDGMPEACALSMDNLTVVAKGALPQLDLHARTGQDGGGLRCSPCRR